MKAAKKNSQAAKVIRKGLGFKPDDQSRLDRIREALTPEMGELRDMTIVRLALIRMEQQMEAGK